MKIQQENDISNLLSKIRKVLTSNDDSANLAKIKYIPCLAREYLFANEYKEVIERHKSVLYKQMSAGEQYKYDLRLEQEIRLTREQYRSMRMPPLSDKELEKYLGSYGEKGF